MTQPRQAYEHRAALKSGVFGSMLTPKASIALTSAPCAHLDVDNLEPKPYKRRCFLIFQRL